MALVLLFALVALCFVIVLKVGPREKGLPPGPPTVPILGNAHIFPIEFPHYKFTEWARKYGGLFSDWTLIVNRGHFSQLKIDVAAVKELLDKLSSTTADRPPCYIGNLVSDGLNMAFASFSCVQLLPIVYRGAHHTLSSSLEDSKKSGRCDFNTASYYRPKQPSCSTTYFIRRNPSLKSRFNQSFYSNIQRYSLSVIYSVLHGKRVPRYETEEVTRFITRARYFGLLEDTRKRMRRNQHNGSFMEVVLERQAELGMDDEMAGWFSGTLLGFNLFGAPVFETDTVLEDAADTTSSYIQSLLLALVAHPQAQKKAHEEIDPIVGEHRMPTLEDLEQMPYFRAIISEVGTPIPSVAPLTLPHASLTIEKLSKYHGYIIPKGTTIFVNMWGIFHDPGKYTLDPTVLFKEFSTL
ncbi:cytochrome P450 [Mycena olivaceomarginata]|nr:cytochrome P450 [Mycena olivaceomarginata]